MGPSAARRYLWVYSAANDWTVAWHERQQARRRGLGYDVEYYCNTPAWFGRAWLPFPELDYRWRTGDARLMRLYAELVDRLAGRDVLILYNGANLHPEFVRMLDVVRVYTAGDPESADILARPLSPAFDIHLSNQAAEIPRFQSWGLTRVYFWPLGSQMDEADVADLNEDVIADPSRRTLPVVMLCEYTHWRKEQLDRLQAAFPDALCAGRGWPRGFLSWPDMWASYRRAQIGWNVHNTTGFNFRTFELAAHGAMQICDNKSDLPTVFEPGKEVVGFDTTDECVDLTRYYLDHPQAQRDIAVAAFRRWKAEYTPDRIWERLVRIVESHDDLRAQRRGVDPDAVKARLRDHARRAAWRAPILRSARFARRAAGYVRRRIMGP